MPTKTRKPAVSPEAKAAAIAAAHASIATEVGKITTSEEWKNWLRKASKFHKYSFNNLILLQVQAMERGMSLTQVAGFQTWLSLNRGVRKGEKGLAIFAPVIVPIKPGEKGYVEGLKRTKLVGFKLTYVFDVSQTDGEPLQERPTFSYPEGEVPEGFLDRLHALAEQWGYPIRTGITSHGGQADGHTDPVRKEIVMSPRLVGNDARYAGTAIHELAHSQLHVEGDFDYTSHRGLAETEAESIAFIVGDYFGLDMGTESFHYVAGWGKDPEAVVKAGTRIMATARKIIDALEGE